MRIVLAIILCTYSMAWSQKKTGFWQGMLFSTKNETLLIPVYLDLYFTNRMPSQCLQENLYPSLCILCPTHWISFNRCCWILRLFCSCLIWALYTRKRWWRTAELGLYLWYSTEDADSHAWYRVCVHLTHYLDQLKHHVAQFWPARVLTHIVEEGEWLLSREVVVVVA